MKINKVEFAGHPVLKNAVITFNNAPGDVSEIFTLVVSETIWRTSMFYSTTSKTYLLPIKSQVRKKEALLADELLDVAIVVQS